MYQVRDVMNVDVLTVSQNVTVAEAIRRLIHHHISGMPVVDNQGHLVGIVSEFQLLETLYSPQIQEMLVRDVMTKDVLTVTPDKTLTDATSLMIRHRIRRLPVIDGDKIVGIVSRHDLLKSLDAGDEIDTYLEEIKACACSSTNA